MKYILIPFFGMVIALVAVEAVVRIMTAMAPSETAWSDRPRAYYKPELSQTLQDQPYSVVKPANTFRIAVIGDSFTFAPHMQFDDAFPKKLERMLNLNNIVDKVEVVNYGVPGYSTKHEVKVMRQAIAEQADLVILQLTLNDPEAKPYRPSGLKGINRFGKFLPTKSQRKLFSYWKTAELIAQRLHNSRTHARYIKYYFKFNSKPRRWDRFKAYLKTIAKLSNESSVPLVATIFPLFGLPLDDRYPFHPLHGSIADIFQELNIPYLDLFDAFKHIPLPRIQIIPGVDFHPNEIGHRIAAEHIYDWLTDAQLIPQEFIIKDKFETRTDIRVMVLE
ncbi:SGNH/GDSL hydrolase family protein [Oligoflexia bacterium]|nr:SGNH/GDSL hydrolase family protein [Oligoflexia bacterium]